MYTSIGRRLFVIREVIVGPDVLQWENSPLIFDLSAQFVYCVIAFCWRAVVSLNLWSVNKLNSFIVCFCLHNIIYIGKECVSCLTPESAHYFHADSADVLSGVHYFIRILRSAQCGYRCYLRHLRVVFRLPWNWKPPNISRRDTCKSDCLNIWYWFSPRHRDGP